MAYNNQTFTAGQPISASMIDYIDNAVDRLDEVVENISNADKFYGIDTTNILASYSSLNGVTMPSNGFLVWKNTANYHGALYIDSKEVDSAPCYATSYDAGNGKLYGCTPVKKGQVVKVVRSSDKTHQGSSGTLYGFK